MKTIKILFWISIVVIVYFTRFYSLDRFPPHLTIDEVAIGYNAFSLLKTGGDEWGNYLPASFRSVGDYKAPTLVYLTIPFVSAFGLTEFATRLPVAIFSAFSVFLFWLLVSRYLFKKQPLLAYLSTLIFSLSPWLIPFSRSGFESIVALAFLLINLIFAFEFRNSGKLTHFFWMYTFAFISATTYHSAKIVVPLLNLSFLILDYKFFTECLKKWFSRQYSASVFASLIFATMSISFVCLYVLGVGGSRASMTMLSKDFDYARALLPTFMDNPFSWFTSSFGLLSLWYKRFLEYFSARFYLSSGLGLATPGHPGQGVLYAIEYPFFVLGIILLIFKKKLLSTLNLDGFILKFLTIWLLVSLIPASITNNSLHALRTLNAVPVVSILISLAVGYILGQLKNRVLIFIFVFAITAGYIVGIIRFVDYFTVHYPHELSETRSYGWKEISIFARDHHHEYDRVYVDPRFGTEGPYTYGVPYLYLLFYSEYDPHKYQTGEKRHTGSTDFENYIFGPINWQDIDHSGNNLYLASPWSFPEEIINSDKVKLYVPFLNQSSGLYAISDR